MFSWRAPDGAKFAGLTDLRFTGIIHRSNLPDAQLAASAWPAQTGCRHCLEGKRP
jgi:hypothetical protein